MSINVNVNETMEYDCFFSLLYERENYKQNRRIYRENMKRDKEKRKNRRR